MKLIERLFDNTARKPNSNGNANRLNSDSAKSGRRTGDFSQVKNRLFALLCVLSLLVSVILTLCSFFLYFPPKESNDVALVEKKFTIVLDAGHGGIDGGVVASDGTKESDLNLLFVKLLAEKFEAVGATVVLTRETKNGLYGVATDGFKRRDMQKRKEIIEHANPDILVSIHMNKFTSSSRYGPQVFYQEKDATSQVLASKVQNALNAFTGNSHSHLSGDYYILKCLEDKPCVIVECGFLSNSQDLRLLTSQEYQKALTNVIFKGVMLYLYQT